MDTKPEGNPRVVINRNPDAPPGTSKLNPGRRQASKEAAEGIMARRAAIHRRARDEIAGNHAADAAQAAKPVVAPPERENIDSIEITLRNGMAIVYGPPSGISLMDRIARLYAGRDPSAAEYRLTRLLMGVRSINGQPEPPMANEIARTDLANRLGDEGIDILAHYDKQFWPPLMLSELPVVKKNLRA